MCVVCLRLPGSSFDALYNGHPDLFFGHSLCDASVGEEPLLAYNTSKKEKYQPLGGISFILYVLHKKRK